MGKLAKKKSTSVKETSDRKNGKASKQSPKVFDPVKRRLVNAS